METTIGREAVEVEPKTKETQTPSHQGTWVELATTPLSAAPFVVKLAGC